MPVAVTSIPGAFAGEVSGIDCAAPLTQADVRAIDAAMERHAVIVSHDQKLTDEQQIAFTKSFGELERYETPGHIRKREQERLGRGIADFSNLTREGAIMAPEDRVWLFKLADRLWHSDSSYRPVPAKWSLLSGRTIPPRGGETELADMLAAYDALDDETRAEIEDLVCEHSLIYSREAIGFTELTPEEREHFRPVR
ncbi:MAG TPA: TauD/TfdA family dioxygenase, partial [Roseiarcus sp.]|nr:TauD/TfdA family dioxygenase [Roseiarcus sp.]